MSGWGSPWVSVRWEQERSRHRELTRVRQSHGSVMLVGSAACSWPSRGGGRWWSLPVLAQDIPALCDGVCRGSRCSQQRLHPVVPAAPRLCLPREVEATE